ncbi:hypothetical protein BN946_scf184750.g2 [Trametes cinnabarina]|uniref:Peptidase S9 prolyl oligopeptidase catalytic domain-containing protein n=1 Tax=Pycnoporus cinnabarinus TaxID=5643 RepID=A0A060SPP4_PYCCI|nr:hypothetical protein BN946_scf184750.g2 [Trametes cinnabarina]
MYDIFVSGDYEIRLFGDPRHDGESVPKLSITLTVDIEQPDGWAFGDALGVGVTAHDGWWTMQNLTFSSELQDSLKLELLHQTRLAPTQTRVIPIKLTQTRPIALEMLRFTLEVVSENATTSLDIALPVRQRERWMQPGEPGAGIKASYFWGGAVPTAFLVTAPQAINVGHPKPPMVREWISSPPISGYERSLNKSTAGPYFQQAALHGAWTGMGQAHKMHGVRWTPFIKFYTTAFSGENGVSRSRPKFCLWDIRMGDKEPGTWRAGSPIKWSELCRLLDTSNHKPIRAILDSSLTPDDNDLFLSNLVDTPILAIHGGNDENVPVWHTREAVSVLKTWNPDANVTFREDPGEPHWYPSVFENEQVRSFISSTLESTAKPADGAIARVFTLTVAIPSDSGSMHGWSILALTIPGRLGRLTVEIGKSAIRVHTKNVKAFSIHLGALPKDTSGLPIHVDGKRLPSLVNEERNTSDRPLTFAKSSGGQWMPHVERIVPNKSPTGRIAKVLDSARAITIVIPAKKASQELSAALRLAHNLDVYLKLDADIIVDEEAVQKLAESSLGSGNIIVLGLGHFAQALLRQQKTAFGLTHGVLTLKGRLLDKPNMATLFLHPHPEHASSVILFMHGVDSAGLERALRVFPIRTGVTVPDWIVLGGQADERGTAGVEGAGVWGNDCGWNEAVSAF